MARIDGVEDTQRSESFSYFRNAIRGADSGLLDRVATDVARQLFDKPYDTDTVEAEWLRETVFGSALDAMGLRTGQNTASEGLANLKDINSAPGAFGALAISEELVADIADLGQAVEQHIRLKESVSGPSANAGRGGPSQDFGMT